MQAVARKLIIVCMPLVCSCSLLFSSSDNVDAGEASLDASLDASLWTDAAGDAALGPDARQPPVCDTGLGIELQDGGEDLGTAKVMVVIAEHMLPLTDLVVTIEGPGSPVLRACFDTAGDNPYVWKKEFYLSQAGAYTAVFEDMKGVDPSVQLQCEFYVPNTGDPPSELGACPDSTVAPTATASAQTTRRVAEHAP